jgi:hypothetical protein
VRCIIVVVLCACLVGGCSFTFSRVPDRPQRSADCPRLATPIADVLLTPVTFFLGVLALAGSNARGGEAVILLLPSAATLGSSVYGFAQYGRCRGRLPPQR